MKTARSARSSLQSRWLALARRWTAPVSRMWGDLWDYIGIQERADRKRSTLLDVLPLEKRELPAFALALQANAAPDPWQSPVEAVRRVSVNPHDGSAKLSIPFDIFKSDSGPPTALVYDSNTTNVKPVLQFQVTSDAGDSVPTSIVGTLTFNGSGNSAVTFTTTGHSAGDDYLIALQHGTQITASGYYTWSVSVTVNLSGQDPVNLSANGSMEIVVRDTSSDYFGRGWSLAGFDKLVIDRSGVLYVYGGTGGARRFTGTSGTLTNPANDFGTLVKNQNNTYTYTDPQQNVKKFDSSGNMTSAVDPHGLPITFTYSNNKLSTIATFDGATTSFSYDGSGLLQTIVQPGSRTITFAHASGNDLTTATLPDGGLRSFTYDANHKLTVEKWGDQTATLTYAATGMLSAVDPGKGDWDVTPMLSQGLTTTPAKNASEGVGLFADPLGNTTTYTLDTRGRATKITMADGGAHEWTLNSAGLPTKYTDPLSQVTSFTYSSGTPDITKIEYPDGGVVTMSYHANYHTPTEIIDQLGRRTTFTYDANNGDLLTVKDALDQTTTFTWGTGSTNGLLETVTDPLGRTTTYSYDSNNRRLDTVDDALNLRTTYNYDAAGNTTFIQIPFTGHFYSSANVTIVYDGMRRVTSTEDSLARRTTYTYNALGQLTDQRDQLNRQTTNAYDVRGNLTGTTQAAGTSDERRLTYTYDALDRQVTAVDGLGRTTSFGYDAMSRLTKITDALSNVTTFNYDAAGQLTSSINALGDRTTFSYDAMGRNTVVQNALGDRTTTTYDLAGNTLSVKNANNVTTSYAYDSLNRVTQIIEDDGGSLERTTTIGYDAVGNTTSITDPRGNTTTFTYDAIDRLTQREDPLNQFTTITYNAASQSVATTKDALGNTTTLSYDQAFRVTVVTRPGLQAVVTYAYDAADNLTSEVNELSKRTTYSYDNLNRLTEIRDANNGRTTFAYDDADNRTLVIDPVGNRTTFVYDSLNRVTTETDPLNNSATFAYDAIGRLTSTTDKLGRRRDFTYDDTHHKLTEKWYTSGNLDQTQTWTYDALGNMLTAVDPDGTNTFTYDALNRISTVNEPFGLTLTYTYDAADNRTLVQDSKGGTLTSTYDAANRLTARQFSGNSATLRYNYDYSARDEITKITRFSDTAGTTTVGWTSYTYDSKGRVTNINHRDSSNSALQNTTYQYDAHDRMTYKTVNGSLTTYGYDSIDQLTGDGTATYTYDANGNRTMSGYTTGSANQTTNDGTWTYTYDAAGNRTKKSKGSSLETWTYGYDHHNRLIWVEKRATDGGTLQQKVEYKYDALGNRIERTIDQDGNGTTDNTERFGFDGMNAWAHLDGSNNLTYRRLFGDGIDTPIARVSSGGTVIWYLTDHQNSVIGLVNSSGSSLGVITYDGFGNILTDTTGANGDHYRYTGREWDAAIDLQYNRARYYDAAIGKWISMDPIGFDAGDANLYRYVGNNTMTNTDPSGLDEFWLLSPLETIRVIGGWRKVPSEKELSSPIQVTKPPVIFVVADPNANTVVTGEDGFMYVQIRPVDQRLPKELQEVIRQHEYIHIRDLIKTDPNIRARIRKTRPGMAVTWADPRLLAESEVRATDDSLRRLREMRRTRKIPRGFEQRVDRWIDELVRYREANLAILRQQGARR